MSEEISKVSNENILNLLFVAEEKSSLLQIMVNYEPPACMSHIHSFATEDNSFLIDLFGISSLDELFMPGVGLEVAFKVGEIAYRFDSTAMDKSSIVSDAHFILLPKEMELIKRRMYFRVTPPDEGSVKARIQFKSTDNPTDAKVLNLSVGGVLISRRYEEDLPELGSVVLLTMKFDDGNSFSFKSRVCHISSDENSPCCVGLEFLNQVVSDEVFLGGILMQWQEKEIGEF